MSEKATEGEALVSHDAADGISGISAVIAEAVGLFEVVRTLQAGAARLSGRIQWFYRQKGLCQRPFQWPRSSASDTQD